MDLQIFTRKGMRSNIPKVSINSAGQIGLNATCMNKYVKNTRHVLLLGDITEKIIGIKLIDEHQDNSFAISCSIDNGTGSISGTSFLKFMEIDYKNNPQSMVPEWNEKERMLIIKIK